VWAGRHAFGKARSIHGAPENDAGFRHGRGDDVWIIAFLCDTLTEEIAVRAPGFQGSLHRWRSDRQIEEARRRLKDLEFSCHEVRSRPGRTSRLVPMRAAPPL
jgi:hypothetical protein